MNNLVKNIKITNETILKNRIKVVTYNVHMWKTADGKKNVDLVSKTIKDIKPDIIGLEEVYRVFGNSQVLVSLSKNLQIPFHTFAESFGAFGNALMSSFPIKDKKVIDLDFDHEEKRIGINSVISVPLFISNQNEYNNSEPVCSIDLNLIVTHLDHRDEGIRLGQLKILLKEIGNENENIIIGDFNSLQLKDYSTKEFKRIQNHRSSTNWEPPKGDVTLHMEKQNYHDCWVDGGKEGAIPTCWAETRIDYIFASKNFFNKPRQVDIHPIKIFKDKLTNQTSYSAFTFSSDASSNINLKENGSGSLVEKQKNILESRNNNSEIRNENQENENKNNNNDEIEVIEEEIKIENFKKLEITCKLISCKRFESVASDHHPVVMEFEIIGRPIIE